MILQPDRFPRWKRHDQDGSSPSTEEMLDPNPVSRSITVTFHPMLSSTLMTVITTSRGGHRRWDRRRGTLVVPVTVAELRGLDTEEALDRLLRAALYE